MRLRAKDFNPALNKDVVAEHVLAQVPDTKATLDAIEAVVDATHRPQFSVEDKDKNCQTWVDDVISRLVQEKTIPAVATTNLGKVPRASSRTPSPSSSVEDLTCSAPNLAK